MNAKEVKFKSVSKTEWETKIIKDLKGKDLSEVSTSIGTNILTKPNYHEEDGATAVNAFRKDKDWNMGYYAKSNKEAILGLQQGMNSLRLNNSSNISQALENVQLDIINVFTPINSQEDISKLSDFIDKNKNNNINPFVVYSEDDLELTIENKRAFSDNNETRTILISSDLQLTGISSSNAIASLLLQASSLISKNLTNDNLNISSKDIVFKWKIGINYLEEIAAIRALRICLNNVFNAHNIDFSNTYIAAEPNEYFFANNDTANNILRESTMHSSAILGGADEVISVKYNTSDNPKETNRIAQNIQLILKEESHFNEVKDPSKGSYYIEFLTKAIADKSWSIFQQLSDKSDLKHALNELNKDVQKETTDQIADYKLGKKTLLGENKFQNPFKETPSNFNSIANKIN